MALEAVVFPRYALGYGAGGLQERDIATYLSNWDWKSSSVSSPMGSTLTIKDLETNFSSSSSSSSSPETCAGSTDGIFFSAGRLSSVSTIEGRKRRRSHQYMKNQDAVDHQRMTHIAVERNRRKQMNDYLAILRSMMPPSYTQRGDQASIIGGAINFVKELEQQLQSMEAHKRIKKQSDHNNISTPDHHHHVFSDFFSFPQYSTRTSDKSNSTYPSSDDRDLDQDQYSSMPAAEKLPKQSPTAIADVEVTMVESHANLKILSRKQPKQILKMVAGLCSLHLNVLHLNVTTIDYMVLCSLNVKIEDECQMTSVKEIAAAVYGLVRRIQGEAAVSSFSSD